MLDGALQINEGRQSEESGKRPEHADAEGIYDRAFLLERAATVGAEAASNARDNGWKGDWLLLFQALCSLTARQAHEGDPAPLFTAERLRQEIASIVGAPEAQWWSEESDSARKKFTNAWKALENDLSRIDENLRGRAVKSGVPGGGVARRAGSVRHHERNGLWPNRDALGAAATGGPVGYYPGSAGDTAAGDRNRLLGRDGGLSDPGT